MIKLRRMWRRWLTMRMLLTQGLDSTTDGLCEWTIIVIPTKRKGTYFVKVVKQLATGPKIVRCVMSVAQLNELHSLID